MTTQRTVAAGSDHQPKRESYELAIAVLIAGPIG
jgi:hypothetical protein